ncbi:MAG: heme exporter protein CcmB [Chlorobia bacterium]|nr:heme exporter protein CcmB [Fimbriimonadaceae bacterium]
MTKGWRAILRKEIRSEMRQRSGLITTVLFSVFTVITISFATFDLEISPQLGAGLLCVAMLFAAIVALPRAVLIEEEQGTGDLLRLVAKAEDVYWGKAIYNLLFMAITSLVLTVLFLGFTRTGVAIPWLFVACIAGSCAAYAGTVTLCGALVAQASNRNALAGVLSVPLLLPLSFLAVSGLRVALDLRGGFNVGNGAIAGVGLLCYGAASLVIGPYLFAAVWKR